MGTTWELFLSHPDEKKAEKAADEIYAEIWRLEKELSLWDKTSELSKLNSKAGQGPVKVSEDILKILKTAQLAAGLSNGACDVTIGPVVKLWGFAGGKQKVPSEKELLEARALVDFRMLKIEEQRKEVTLPKKGMALDFGGIAKGYALDRSLAVLKKYRIKNALLSAGGQLLALGKNPQNEPWKIGIIDPKIKGNTLGTFAAKNKCIATSGSYEQFFVLENSSYSHIFDPAAARPVKGTLSATIILDTGAFASPNTLADALSTALFVSGSKNSPQILKSFPEAQTFFVTEENNAVKTIISENLRGKIAFSGRD